MVCVQAVFHGTRLLNHPSLCLLPVLFSFCCRVYVIGSWLFTCPWDSFELALFRVSRRLLSGVEEKGILLCL